MTFVLGGQSGANLRGVHDDLVRVVRRAITITRVDFAVIEGVRSVTRQAELVKSGASKTLASKHITGDAVDLAAWVGGRHSWDWPLYYDIAEAVRDAAIMEDVKLRWGGVWDRCLNDLASDLEDDVASYVKRRKALGKQAFIDGPHFERFDA
jgi:peptidoglycan L-alanyl-D-glutamate endopeptidase CwlK